MPYDPTAVAGRVFSVSASSPVSYGAIPGISGLQYSGNSRTRINVTSISDEDEQSIPGRRANGTVSFNLFLDAAWATHAQLLANFNDNNETLLLFKDVKDDAGDSERTFSGYVSQWDETADVDGANMVAVVIQVTGAITDAP